MKTILNKIFRSAALVSLLLVSFNVFAQQKMTVQGTVKDSKGEPVVGAVVMLDGNTSVGTVTDIDGKYSLAIPASAKAPKLNVSCISYQTQIVPVGKDAMINIVLEDDSEQLDEVVVVGYGSMRKSDLTGSVASVKIDDAEASKSTSLDQMLEGRAAGVEVISSSASPDAGVSIQIRGVTSLNSSSEPLYVIDGVIMTGAANEALLDKSEEVNGLMGINPNDIASIEILKDASATAIYGADGANGVVLITTKQATKDRPTIRFNVGYDISTPYKHIDVLSSEEFIERMRIAKANGYQGLTDSYVDKYIKGWENGTYEAVDWQDYLIHNAPRQRWFLSISGRPKSINYNLSLGYNKTEGLLATTSNQQYTARLNVDKTFSKKFKIGTKVNLAYTDSKTQQGANASQMLSNGSMLRSMIIYRPIKPVVEVVEEEDEEEDDTGDGDAKSSPDRWAKDAYRLRQEYRITPSLYAQYQIAKWLTFKSNIGADYRMQDQGQWKGRTVNRSSGGALAARAFSETYRWTWDNTFMFNTKIKKHNISGTVGMTMSRSANSAERVSVDNVQQYNLQLDNINSAYKTSFSYSESYDSKLSFFVRGIYNYNDRYVLTATYRIDGSSKFLGANKFSHFPSFAFAWRANKEPWFDAPVISMLKLRAGWGRVGNSAVSNYQVYNVFGATTTGYHFNEAGYIKGISISNFSNENLKWETTEQYNVGIDYGMWKGRFTFSADAYYKRTYDLLQARLVPYFSGFSTRWMNVGAISNRGFELTMEATPIRTKLFEWNISGNFSMNRNRLDSIGYDVDSIDIPMRDGSSESYKYYLGDPLGSNIYFNGYVGNIFLEGEELGLFYGIATDGIIQEGETGIPITEGGKPTTAGSINYLDLNGNGYIDQDDRTIIGNPNAGFTYGFNTSFMLGNFTLSLAFQGVGDKDILNANLAQEWDPSYSTPSNFRREAFYGAWSTDNPSNKFMALNKNSNAERYFTLDRYIEDASYLRLSSVTANYNFKLPKTFFIKNITVGASVNNVFVWTNYTGWDPKVSSFGSSMRRRGIDCGSYPSARTYCFDLKFTF